MNNAWGLELSPLHPGYVLRKQEKKIDNICAHVTAFSASGKRFPYNIFLNYHTLDKISAIYKCKPKQLCLCGVAL